MPKPPSLSFEQKQVLKKLAKKLSTTPLLEHPDLQPNASSLLAVWVGERLLAGTRLELQPLTANIRQYLSEDHLAYIGQLYLALMYHVTTHLTRRRLPNASAPPLIDSVDKFILPRMAEDLAHRSLNVAVQMGISPQEIDESFQMFELRTEPFSQVFGQWYYVMQGLIRYDMIVILHLREHPERLTENDAKLERRAQAAHFAAEYFLQELNAILNPFQNRAEPLQGAVQRGSSPSTHMMPLEMPMATDADHKLFMETYGRELAIFAYRSYLERGRGLIYVAVPGEETSEALSAQLNLALNPRHERDLSLLYLTIDEFMTTDLTETDEGTKGLVGKYNPEKQFVIVIPNALGTKTYRQVPFPRSPKELYEQELESQAKAHERPYNYEIVSEEDQMGFIETYQAIIAMFAYGNYIEHGRGFLSAYTGHQAHEAIEGMDHALGDTTFIAINPNNVLFYVPLSRFQTIPKTDDPVFLGIVEQAMLSYDPDVSYVIVFDNNRQTKNFTIRPGNPEEEPKALYEMFKSMDELRRSGRFPHEN